MSKICLVKI